MITIAISQKPNTPLQFNTNYPRFSNQRWKLSNSLQWNSNNQQLNSNNQQNRRQYKKIFKCQLCQKFDRTAAVCLSKSHKHFEAKANFASILYSSGNSRILDPGATHHVTTNPHNLEEYTWTEEISMGDGKTIPITHTCSSLIQASNTGFKLSNILCAQLIKKMLFLSKFFKISSYLFNYFLLLLLWMTFILSLWYKARTKIDCMSGHISNSGNHPFT